MESNPLPPNEQVTETIDNDSAGGKTRKFLSHYSFQVKAVVIAVILLILSISGNVINNNNDDNINISRTKR